MELTKQDKAWLAALDGTGPAYDLETRQAAELRGFFQKQLADDLATQVDPAVRLRILNGLRASGVLGAPSTERNSKGLGAWLEWLGLAGASGGWGVGSPRLALVAGVVAAVVALPLVLDPKSEDSNQDVKSLRTDKTLGQPGGSSMVVFSKDPAAMATSLVKGLTAVGVPAEMASSGGTVAVRAQITAGNLNTANSVLAGLGLSTASSGELVIQFRSQ